MIYNYYRATLNSDSGLHYITVYTRNKKSAMEMIMKAENCPKRSIKKIEKIPMVYLIVKIGLYYDFLNEEIKYFTNKKDAKKELKKLENQSISMWCSEGKQKELYKTSDYTTDYELIHLKNFQLQEIIENKIVPDKYDILDFLQK